MTNPSPVSGGPMTLIASGTCGWSTWERTTMNWLPVSHSNDHQPETTPSSIGCVASVSQVPIRASNGSSAGFRSVMRIRTAGEAGTHRSAADAAVELLQAAELSDRRLVLRVAEGGGHAGQVSGRGDRGADTLPERLARRPAAEVVVA